MLIVFMSSNY